MPLYGDSQLRFTRRFPEPPSLRDFPPLPVGERLFLYWAQPTPMERSTSRGDYGFSRSLPTEGPEFAYAITVEPHSVISSHPMHLPNHAGTF
ncbi:hypothetical protein P3T25_008996 [Paraburkholderia sp. GAS32]